MFLRNRLLLTFFFTGFTISSFHSLEISHENIRPDQGAVIEGHAVAKRKADSHTELEPKSQDDHHGDSHGNRTDPATNTTEHSNHGDKAGSHGKGQAHGIHLVSWNFDKVQAPFIIAVFLLTAGIAKLGKFYCYFICSQAPRL